MVVGLSCHHSTNPLILPATCSLPPSACAFSQALTYRPILIVWEHFQKFKVISPQVVLPTTAPKPHARPSSY
ncbi:hypothetical protein PGTUg99_019780 [Puccinia graminis f. sp. tritici]|uniref:Uncharacterized protein n=1 Tax=Puccinia graminis f. sp. tritici TaxID=56615 RepID=A0A5B0S735_PUCGR|nr:hypothetical protein PGTUg99_019780 [Puccinia graminis f. sp. tritici]